MVLRNAINATFAILICVVCVSMFSAADEQSKPKTVDLAEIVDGRVEIVGLLGLPIGEVVDLRGVWVEPPNLSSSKEPRRFEVTHVNGSRLKKPIAYFPHSVHQWNRDQVVSKTGDVWDMIAYEAIEVRQHSRLRERLKQPAAADYSGNLASILGEVVKINPQ